MKPGISDRARVSRIRNWKLLQLRGLYYKASLLLPEDRASIEPQWREAIDRAIVALGAEPQTDKEHREWRELYERLQENTDVVF